MRTGGAAVALILSGLVACSSTTDPSATPDPHAAPVSAFQRTFGPGFPPVPPTGDPQRIDGAVLSHDRSTLSVAFIGGQAYDRTKPCSEDYGAWAGRIDQTLEVQVIRIAHADQAPMPPNTGCTLEGYTYLFQLRLPDPYLGVAVRDRSSGPLWVAQPEATAELVPIPGGWWLSRIVTEQESRMVGREWHPAIGSAGAPDRFLALYQVFNGPPAHTIDTPIATRTIRGQNVEIGQNGDDGYLVTWKLGNDGMSLITYDKDLTIDMLVAMANAVAVPDR